MTTTAPTSTAVRPRLHKSASAQQTFDFVATHLITQGEPALNREGACQYRGPRGTQCAVGCLIDDEDYSQNFEAADVHDLRVQKALGRLSRHTSLLAALQGLHDDCEPVHTWPRLLRNVANEHGLSAAAVPLA